MPLANNLPTLIRASSSALLREAARSKNTRVAYFKGWCCFSDWCKRIGQNAIKATSDDVVNFFVEMATTNRPNGYGPLSINTLRLYRSGLNDKWRQLGIASPASSKAVDEVFKGLARLRGDAPRRVKAIREHQMLEILRTCGGGLHAHRDAALLSLGFSAALRRSELCHLRIEDLEQRECGGLVVHIQRSKTDQLGIGQKIAVPEGKQIKPVAHVYSWLKLSGIRTGFVFQTLGRGGVPSGKPVDPGDVAKTVKKYVARIGLNKSEYSGHSLRAGFVTSAAAHHARIDKIMEVTRHRSAETVLKYIRDEESFTDHAGASFL